MTVRVLIVEDEAILALALEALLTGWGHEVVGVARTAQQAVSQAERLRPDLTLMDINLSGSADGISAAERIRHAIGTGHAFVTAAADAPTLARARATEPVDILHKPFLATQLQGVLAKAAGTLRPAAQHPA